MRKVRVKEALSILDALDVPRAQRNERSALTLLALLGLPPDRAWSQAANPFLGITEMMDWFRTCYGKIYKPNTRETVRRQTMHQFVQMGLAVPNPDQPDRPVNSPKYGYVLEPAVVKLARLYGTRQWRPALVRFIQSCGSLKALHHQERRMTMIPVKMPKGNTRHLSAGGQNRVIKTIIEEFCPRFTPGGEVIYIGDAGGKPSSAELASFASLGIQLDAHGKMPAWWFI